MLKHFSLFKKNFLKRIVSDQLLMNFKKIKVWNQW